MYWSLKVFQDCEQIDSIIVAAAEGELERVREIAEQYHLDKVRTIIQGGATRLESVKQSLSGIPSATSVVLVHDGARPFVTEQDVSALIQEVRESHQGAILGIPLSDTLHLTGANMMISNTLNRQICWRAQTPQCFPKGVLIAAYASYDGVSPVTDDASLVRQVGGNVKILPGSVENIKITDPIDLQIAEVILANRG